MTTIRNDWNTDANDDLSADIWDSAWLWIVLGAAAIVTVELIDTSAGVVVLALKFGWNDWAAAIWLLRTDPVPRRGRSCFWFHLALGCWMVCVWTFALLFVGSILMAWIEMAPGQNAQPLPRHFIVAAMTWTISLVVATAVTMVAVASAWTNRVRVWVDPTVGRSRQRQEWPPMASGTNSARRLIIAGLIVPTTIASVVSLVTVINLLQQAIGIPPAGPNQVANVWEPIVIGGACFLTIALPAVLVMVGAELLRRRVEATSPVQCWPELLPSSSR